jgi:sensor histidine kinase regulating citrate/malate metabolism
MAVIRNNHVKFTCVVDGALLDFLHVTDICTIFGNALDNAVESVLMVEDPEKRLVHMRVSAKKQLLCIEVSNYCDHPVKIKDGMPVTTKSDKRQHGFGVKSILYTAKKYGGNVNFSLHKGPSV